ncbi:MAG: hypothetical protein ACRD34_11760 [Bryobacteraceae bacterium]
MPRTYAAPNRELLEAALQGLEAQKQKIDDQMAQVRALMGQRAARPAKQTSGASATASQGGGRGRRRRVLSPEARRRIAAAQKKRWAAFRKSQAK